MVSDATDSPKRAIGDAPAPVKAKKTAKDSETDPSVTVEDRIRELILAGDMDGAVMLMNGILAETTGYHCRRLGISDFQDDCLQETMLRIIKRWELVVKSDKLIGYIRKIAFRTVITQFRKIHRIPEQPFPMIDTDSDDPAVMEFQQDVLPGADRVMLIAESYSLLKQALDDVYRAYPGCRDSLKLYQDAQNDSLAFETFCKKLHVDYQAMFARFRRCVEKIINHHLFHTFSDIVGRLYPNIHRGKQRKRLKEGNHHEL
jgi:DNA-directed RNA polymerase specialized sigma24 family protein